MSRIVILGGYGYAGRRLAPRLLERTGAEIVLAGRHLDKAQAYAGELNATFGRGGPDQEGSEDAGPRVSAVRADATSAQDLRLALAGADLLVVASPVTQSPDTVIRAALAAGVDYVDIQFNAQKLALLRSLAPEIERSGRCFITEAGFHPGLPAAMVRAAAAQLDRLDAAIVGGYLNIGRQTPYSEAVDELMEVFLDYQAQVFKDGSWTQPGSWTTRRIDFGREIGERRCFSMFFEELRDLPGMIPALRETGFYMSETHWLVDWVITPIVLAGLKIAPRRGLRPLGKLMWWGMQNLPKPPHLALLKVEASGEKDGRPARFGMAVSHEDGYELTAIPVVACLEQVLDGSARRPGLWMMGHLVDPLRLFRDMEEMGARVSRRVQV